MALDFPTNDKMMHEAPAKKEWLFAPTAERPAAVIYADNIDEATAIYNRTVQAPEPVKPEPEAPAAIHRTDGEALAEEIE